MKKIFNVVKNERGLTLIELLAVVVILGIIAAIAVPSIGGIIDNSKRDAHIANAEQMVSSVRIAQASDVGGGESDDEYKLSYLRSEGFIENMDSPGDVGDYTDDSSVTIDDSDGSEPEYTITLSSEDGDYISEATLEELRSDGDGDNQGRDMVDLDGEAGSDS